MGVRERGERREGGESAAAAFMTYICFCWFFLQHESPKNVAFVKISFCVLDSQCERSGHIWPRSRRSALVDESNKHKPAADDRERERTEPRSQRSQWGQRWSWCFRVFLLLLLLLRGFTSEVKAVLQGSRPSVLSATSGRKVQTVLSKSPWWRWRWRWCHYRLWSTLCSTFLLQKFKQIKNQIFCLTESIVLFLLF